MLKVLGSLIWTWPPLVPAHTNLDDFRKWEMGASEATFRTTLPEFLLMTSRTSSWPGEPVVPICWELPPAIKSELEASGDAVMLDSVSVGACSLE